MPSARRLSVAAHNVLHQMASGLAHDGQGFLAQHLAWAAARAEAPEIRLDLVAGRVEPPAAATPALTAYAAAWRERWPAILAGVGADPAAVGSLVVVAAFDLARRASAGDFLDGDGAWVSAQAAVITDARGVAHVGAPPRNQLYLAP
jgi:hypothetical protein